MPKKNVANLTIQFSLEEKIILEEYCEKTQRTKSDVIREMVRSLKKYLDSSSSGNG
ncbi:ribbon-helix-helix protein, CopG family [Nostoc sp. UHCC 0251]|uniref:ribbon-helix-helix protein, CopG family n=1 Tax=Nostoc sp. UHCC 0251 TaxID=3110240 RepID=UPI002B2082CF|nr:ribbon-helix-helix protein, CopG family [Nostoc sp. UHCC 0251]MEA5621827.1 ribbon-helix-helix protein, CopG family [Nostoc sp. UHCC 0251]